MNIKDFWSEFLDCLKSQKTNISSKYSWGELVSPEVHNNMEKGQENCTQEEIENCGLMGIDFRKYNEKPNNLKYHSSTCKHEAGTITVQGENHLFTFPVKLKNGIWQLTTGKYQINTVNKSLQRTR